MTGVIVGIIAVGVVIVGTYFALLHPFGGRFEWRRPADRPTDVLAEGTVETVRFPCGGDLVEGWLFTPPQRTSQVVIMAPGLTSTKDSGLESFAWAFVRAGWAVVLFDFRGHGGSQGRPRHWVEPTRQTEDYGAALSWAAERYPSVVLWGSSFSAGAAISAAVRSARCVAGVIAQVPFLATIPQMRPRGLRMARFVALTMVDLLRSKLAGDRLPAVYVPAFGRPGEFAFAASHEHPSRSRRHAEPGHRFFGELPDQIRGGWRNVLAARMLATIDDFEPLAELPRLSCPILLIGAQDDEMIPLSLVRQGASVAPRSRLLELACEHYSVYLPPVRDENLEEQVEFLATLGDD